MRYLAFYFMVILAILFLACSPKLKSTIFYKNNTSWDETKGFVILGLKDSTDLSEFKKIASLKAGDSGFTVRCDYNTMMNLIKTEAVDLGANVLKITRHTKPNIWSTCHRIEARAYFVDDLWKYEKEIVWNPHRKLKIRDFKETTENRPFQAKTNSFIKYIFDKSEKKGYLNLKFKSIFSCETSYFKKSENDSLVLRHEQNHFDITEIYSRKLTKQLIERKFKNMKELDNDIENIVGTILDGLDKIQDKYDFEVYSNPDLEGKWNQYVEGELMSLQEYEEKSVEIKS